MTFFFLLFCGSLVAFISGCFGNPELIKALASDTGSICGKVITPYGGTEFLRSNMIAGKATCNGMTIEITPCPAATLPEVQR